MTAKNIVDETARFDASGLLVSRTDAQGEIISINKVFECVSGYDWEGLQNTPHKVVRHSDMPKGVFWLIWKTLKQKKPIGVYIKNMAKDGSYYWVFLVIVSQGDGYLSIGIKPTSVAIEAISMEYSELSRAEQQEGLSAAQSAKRLQMNIAKLGYRDYAHFASASASEQFMARSLEFKQKTSDQLAGLAAVASDWKKVSDQCDRVRDAHGQISNAPTNLRVQAAHLNDRGIPLSVIASNFTIFAAEIETIMAKFLQQALVVEDQLSEAAFSFYLEALIQEVADICHEEISEERRVNWTEEATVLERQRQSCKESAAQTLASTHQEFISFSNLLEETSRIMSGLSVAKVMCEIENAYVGANSSSGVTDIISDLDQFQTIARNCLFDIRLNLTQIVQSTQNVQSNLAENAA